MTFSLSAWETALLDDTADTSVDAANARAPHLDDSVIPAGSYCYSRLVQTGKDDRGFPTMTAMVCPYWAADPTKPDQQYGYCAKLKAGDWEDDGPFLLWDMVKECGINDDDPENTEEETL